MTQKLRNSLQMIDTNKMKSKVTMTTPHIAFVPRFDDSFIENELIIGVCF